MNEPISDSDLHAYVDGHLGAGRRAAVETWLAAHPDAAARVRGWKADAEALRAALGDGAALPEAPRLDPLRVRGRVHARRWDTMARAAVLVLALGLGGVGGWWARDGRDARSAPPMADAVTAYRLLSESQAAMDFEGDRSDGLQRWLVRNFDEAGRVPDLSEQGYRLRGARMLATAEGAAAMLVYENGGGEVLGIYLRPRTHRMREGERRDGGLMARYWSQGDTAIAVVSSRFDERAGEVAPLVRRGG